MRREVTGERQRRMADMQTQVEEGLSISGVQLGKTLGTGPAQSERFAAHVRRSSSPWRSAPSWPAGGGWPR